ncbi:hypothetical protein ACX27_07890 [Nostoc piscinale CENA21]|uniref:Uncharacterized protein n=1 Tax=Nostoc piscinale CENA21 TaxID=224013 RepID=A0A0M4TJC1_9NOSO|nr:hypothetical protein [Nostoc piscinale]ALF52799.1 hypothetical protein ACX27_07890 [Nostoc piscinale CENA21]
MKEEDKRFLQELAIRYFAFRKLNPKDIPISGEEAHQLIAKIKEKEKELGITPFHPNYLEIINQEVVWLQQKE